MERIKGKPLKKRIGSGNIAGKPSKVHYNGKSGSVRICISAEGGLKARDLIYIETLPNGMILIIPEDLYNATLGNT